MKIIKTVKYAQASNPLNGKSKAAAKNYLYQLIVPLVQGIFSDNYWKPVHDIFRTLDAHNIDWNTTAPSKYFHNDEGVPERKEWYFKINFVNNNGRNSEILGYITAAGAGSVEDPLERYDLVVGLN